MSRTGACLIIRPGQNGTKQDLACWLVMAGIQEWRQLESFTAEIETEDRVISLTASAVTVANAAPPTSIWLKVELVNF